MHSFTKTWLNRAGRVVNFVNANPGSTAQEIAFRLALSISTVHSIIDQYGPANALAVAGKIPVVNRKLKPRWYRLGMPLVRNYKIDVAREFTYEFDDMSPQVRKQMLALMEITAPAILTPSKSIRKRARSLQAAVSQVKLTGAQYQVSLDAVHAMAPRLEAVESKLALLTARQSLESRYGSPELRKAL